MDEPRKITAPADMSPAQRTAKRWRFDAEHVAIRGPSQRPGGGSDASLDRDERKPR
ncbi:MAG: hypothetical protein K2Y37_10385 [Pirellulales bacterium]|nr:hypothetical protein [Pirellulales bacterium]